MADKTLVKDVDQIKKRKKAMQDIMNELDMGPKKKKPSKKGISTKNSPMMKPWGELCKD